MGGFRLLITGPHGFERTVVFSLEDDPGVIAERIRETLEESASDLVLQPTLSVQVRQWR